MPPTEKTGQNKHPSRTDRRSAARRRRIVDAVWAVVVAPTIGTIAFWVIDPDRNAAGFVLCIALPGLLATAGGLTLHQRLPITTIGIAIAAAGGFVALLVLLYATAA